MHITAPGRNQPCPCGSGKKFKHCCIDGPRAIGAPKAFPTAVSAINNQRPNLHEAMSCATAHHQAGRLRKAATIYQEILEMAPNHADALHLLGVVKHQWGRNDEAHDLIQHAISIRPNVAEYHNNLGEVHRAQNRADEALINYQRALFLRPDFPEAHRNVGLAHLALGEPDAATVYLRNALLRFPEALGIYWALGQAFMASHNPDAALDAFTHGLSIRPDDPALLCGKGIALKAAGLLEEAVEHYRHAITLQPQVPALHHNLALIFHQAGNHEAASECLEREIALDPNADSASHLLASLHNTPTERAPASYVRETFDHYADTFDQHLINKLDYHTPALLAQAIKRAVQPLSVAMRILDLGCGTGLFGVEVQDIKTNLTGVDLSPKMVDKASQRGIYDELIVTDLLDFLADAGPDQYDLVAATDVFNYLGNLTPVFERVSRILVHGGYFAFSLEAGSPSADDYHLDTTGRYQHNPNYVQRLCERFGYHVIDFTQTPIRMEQGSAVDGHLVLLQKTSPNA